MIKEKKEKWARLTWEWYPIDGKGTKGRQTKIWEDDFKKITGQNGRVHQRT